MFKVWFTSWYLFSLLGQFPVSWGRTSVQQRRLDDTAPCPDTTETIVAEHTILLDVIGRPGQVSADEINLMRLAFQSAYNQVATCPVSGAFRRVQGVQFLTDAVDAFGDAPTTQGAGLATREFTYAVAVQSVCRGCADGFALFANDGSRQRQLNQKTSLIRGGSTSTETVDHRQLPYYRSRRSRSKSKRGARQPMRMRPRTLPPTPAPICECEPPSLQEFLDVFNAAFIVSSVDSIADAAELTQVEEVCEENTSDFFSTIVLNVIGEPDAATPEQIEAVEQSIIETYNDINALGRGDNCDPLSRIAVEGVSLSIVSGSGLADEAATARAGHLESFSIRVNVPGICRGCDPDANLFQLEDPTEPSEVTLAPTVGIPPPPAPYSPSGSKSSSSDYDPYHRRQLQTVVDCKCSEDAERRAPTETEFLTALNESFQVLREEGLLDFIVAVEDVLEVEEVSCSTEVTTFTTTVPIEFIINVAGITGSDELGLEGAFITAYNNLTQAFCDPTFRMVVRVGISGLRRQDEGRRRLNDGVVPPPTSPPSVSPSPTMTNQPTTTNPPTNFPTFVAGNGDPFFPNVGFASVQATCRGCEENANLYDDVDDTRRNLQALLDLGFRRRLEDGATCFCPADIPEDRQRAPTTDEFQVAYNRTVVALNLDNVLEVPTVFPEIATTDLVPSAAPTIEELEPTAFPETGSPTHAPFSPTAPVCAPYSSPYAPYYSPYAPYYSPYAPYYSPYAPYYSPYAPYYSPYYPYCKDDSPYSPYPYPYSPYPYPYPYVSSAAPTTMPTVTKTPTLAPTPPPFFTVQPTATFPTPSPSPQPSSSPSVFQPPTAAPTKSPTPQPTEAPTFPFPTPAPSPSPSLSP